ncbi:MAG: sugar ABC transporter permease [Clostridiales bacterium]|jgi:multiple sugar transport system permease protein|nr:sugar ABC transporter permease [Clostridiales bacterium]
MKKHVLFVIPSLAGFIVFFILPFLIALGYAFVNKPIGGAFVGLKNFIDLFHNKSYLIGLRNTFIFVGTSVPFNILLSLLAAMLINKLAGKRRELFTLVFLIPLVIPSGSMMFFWRLMFSSGGHLNGILAALGQARVKWLETNWVILIIFLWKNMGYNVVLFLAGLNNIPREYYEAAQADGANALQTFRHITAVCLMPTFLLVLIMSVINSFKVFKEVYLLMGSYPHESVYTLQHFMNNMFYSLDYQKLAAATTVFVLIITAFTQFLFKLERKVSQ